MDLDIRLAKWYKDLQTNLDDLSVSRSSARSLLQVNPNLFSHYLFSDDSTSRKRPRESDHPDKPAREKKGKPLHPPSSKHILEPSHPDTVSLQVLLKMHKEGKIVPPKLPKMKGINNSRGVSLCFPFLLGEECSGDTSCGYHLQAVPDRLPGTDRSDYSTFHTWLRSSLHQVKLSAAAANLDKLKLD